MRIPRMPTPPYPVTDEDRNQQARESAIMREHYASLDRIAQEVLGPVSVKEIEDVVFEMEDNLPNFARRIILMRRQMKRQADALQGLMGHESRLESLERIVESYETKRQRGEWLSEWQEGVS